MLKDFWKLNPAENKQIRTQDEFLQLLKNSKHVCNVFYIPDLLTPQIHPKIKIEDTIFENVSFSKTTIAKILFLRCTFTDCLFVGSKLEKCNFSDCSFKNVNMSYCTFSKTYIQPDYLKSIFPSHTYSNIAVPFYQSLYDNFKDSNQPELQRCAEYYFMKWNFIHTKENIKKHFRSSEKNRIRSVMNLIPRFISLAIQQFFGFGIKIKWYSTTILTVFIFFYTINCYLWNDYQIDPNRTGNHNVVFYTFYSFTSYGSTPMSPTSPLGIFFAILQGFFGWIFIGVGISMIIKKFLR